MIKGNDIVVKGITNIRRKRLNTHIMVVYMLKVYGTNSPDPLLNKVNESRNVQINYILLN